MASAADRALNSHVARIRWADAENDDLEDACGPQRFANPLSDDGGRWTRARRVESSRELTSSAVAWLARSGMFLQLALTCLSEDSCPAPDMPHEFHDVFMAAPGWHVAHVLCLRGLYDQQNLSNSTCEDSVSSNGVHASLITQ